MYSSQQNLLNSHYPSRNIFLRPFWTYSICQETFLVMLCALCAAAASNGRSTRKTGRLRRAARAVCIGCIATVVSLACPWHVKSFIDELSVQWCVFITALIKYLSMSVIAPLEFELDIKSTSYHHRQVHRRIVSDSFPSSPVLSP